MTGMGKRAAAVLATLLCAVHSLAQPQDAPQPRAQKFVVDYVHYRPAVYETQHVFEPDNERPNQGGLVYVYFRNASSENLSLRYWRLNGNDESYWRLDGPLAWDRAYNKNLAPGEMGVLEINGVTPDFAPGAPFDFAYIDRTWRPAGHHKTVLEQDPAQISFLRILPGLNALEMHVRNTGEVPFTVENVAIPGGPACTSEWQGHPIAGGGFAIARVALSEPLDQGRLFIVKLDLAVNGQARSIYAHRRAFEDYFPVGTWTITPQTYDVIDGLHIDTVIQGGSPQDEFYTTVAPDRGFRTVVHIGNPVNTDILQRFTGNPIVACWMIQDEPDWSVEPVIMRYADDLVRIHDLTKPTMITLCRNVKFFEYAPIPDIPCMDHYTVTAPTSSKWPAVYGTRLEETAYYTRDLKIASEPKPIWVWSQAIADWSERPKRPVPTPNELAAQLVLNVGRGAKGILWFNYDHEVAERYPDTRDAVRVWSRALHALNDTLLQAEPVPLPVDAPDKVDVAPLCAWDAVILCVTNLDYQIHPEAYPFVTKEAVAIRVQTLPWINFEAAALVGDGGIKAIEMAKDGPRVGLTLPRLEAAQFIVLASTAKVDQIKARYEAVAEEDPR